MILFFFLHRHLRQQQFNEKRAAVKLSLPFSTTVKVACEQLNNLKKKKKNINFSFIKQLNSCQTREHPHLFLYTNKTRRVQNPLEHIQKILISFLMLN